MKVLLSLILLISLCAASVAQPHRKTTHTLSPFAAQPGSVALENERANELGYRRYSTPADVACAVRRDELVALKGAVSSRLPRERRFARPEAVSFAVQLQDEFHTATGGTLVIDSAVRDALTQRGIRRTNRVAAAPFGENASSHERGCTLDFSKKMSRGQHRWLVVRLLYYRAIGRILVIEERACFHVAVLPKENVDDYNERTNDWLGDNITMKTLEAVR